MYQTKLENVHLSLPLRNDYKQFLHTFQEILRKEYLRILQFVSHRRSKTSGSSSRYTVIKFPRLG